MKNEIKDLLGITIEGRSTPIQRKVLGLYSFDRAFINARGEIGFPLGKSVQVSGPTHTGKSTVVYSLSGWLAENKDIILADLEGYDPNYLSDVLLQTGFAGKVISIGEDEDEEALENLTKHLQDKNSAIGILDSVAAISPIAEQKGEFGEANMGRRAFLVAQLNRRFIKITREADEPKSIFMINHEYPKIGGLGKTYPGGNVKEYLATITISIKRVWRKGGYDTFPDGSYVLKGTVIKNRWGISGREFHLFVLSGKGVHKGLTALYDALQLGLVDRSKVIKIGDQSFGYLKDVIEQAQQGNDEFFQPFYEALKEHGTENIDRPTDDGTDQEDESGDTT